MPKSLDICQPWARSSRNYKKSKKTHKNTAAAFLRWKSAAILAINSKALLEKSQFLEHFKCWVRHFIKPIKSISVVKISEKNEKMIG